jgi:hypothetical protein
MHGDIYKLLPQLMKLAADTAALPSRINLILLSPPWGGVNYSVGQFNLRTMISSGDGIELAVLVSKVCSNIVYLLPRNTSENEIKLLAKGVGLSYRVEYMYLYGKLKMIVVYMGPLFM